MIIVAETVSDPVREQWGVARSSVLSTGYFVVRAGIGHFTEFHPVDGVKYRTFEKACAACKERSGNVRMRVHHERRHLAGVRTVMQRASGLLNSVRRRN